MIRKSKKINIFWKIKSNPFAKRNKDVLFENERKIGSSQSGVAKMITCEDEMKVLMPEILSLSSSSPLWDDRLKYYWDSLSYPVGDGGKELEIGYVYDLASDRTNRNLKLFNEQLEEKDQLKTEEDVLEYFENKERDLINAYSDAILALAKISESERQKEEKIAYNNRYDGLVSLEKNKYKFGKPIEVGDYLIYRYCLGYRDVANDIKYITKSPSIRFYLYSDNQIKEDRKRYRKVKEQAMRLYLGLVSNQEDVENVLYVLGKGDLIKKSGTTETDKQELLEKEYLNNMEHFIKVASDSNIKQKGRIEKLVSGGVLKRLANTEVVVDSGDASCVLGNNLNEAVSYLANDKNKQKLNELITRYNSVPRN